MIKNHKDKYSKTTLKRANFYLNVLDKKKNLRGKGQRQSRIAPEEETPRPSVRERRPWERLPAGSHAFHNWEEEDRVDILGFLIIRRKPQ